jgi:hypothetical protein
MVNISSALMHFRLAAEEQPTAVYTCIGRVINVLRGLSVVNVNVLDQDVRRAHLGPL